MESCPLIRRFPAVEDQVTFREGKSTVFRRSFALEHVIVVALVVIAVDDARALDSVAGAADGDDLALLRVVAEAHIRRLSTTQYTITDPVSAASSQAIEYVRSAITAHLRI